MNFLKVLNTVAIMIPLLFVIVGLFITDLLGLAMISTILTGIIQLIIGVSYFMKFPKNNDIKIYFVFVVLFFICISFNLTSGWIWILPPALCAYLSILIYLPKES
ncbi:heme/copper-type cytochrome/quinol oxidase subunit 4 [Flavobacterium sp. 28A]|uniref:hypothetical protein n=1 Tax=Flavobacterium sp. 28A TaxID=2735895 RepID=UPI00156EF089|nr:hypothetical protein [Flavobacterium sp. 28A]NRT15020.1 heme/copper-type cytochrome/quinol oxidase subunit 4 [Flavobacterium sp. 28A]